MTDWQALVTEFHRKFKQPIGERPRLLDDSRMRLRIGWTDDELGELEEAQQKEDLPEVADAIVDTIVFLIGTAVEMGVDLDPLFREVMAANMRKEGGGERWDGKIAKPVGWVAPDIAGALRKQGWTP